MSKQYQDVIGVPSSRRIGIEPLLDGCFPGSIVDYDGGINDVIERLDGGIGIPERSYTFSEKLAYGLNQAGIR